MVDIKVGSSGYHHYIAWPNHLDLLDLTIGRTGSQIVILTVGCSGPQNWVSWPAEVELLAITIGAAHQNWYDPPIQQP